MYVKLVLNILGKLKEADLQPLYDGLSNEEGLVLLKCVYKAWNYIREYPELGSYFILNFRCFQNMSTCSIT